MTPTDWQRWNAMVSEPVGEKGCRLWLGRCSGFGHGQFRWRGKLVGAHRLAWRLANGGAEIPHGLVVRHFECNRAGCVEGSHLKLGTQADNVADMIDAGRAVVGEAHYAAKLTDEAVLKARELYAAGGFTIVGLARDYGVTDMVMRDALVGKSWRHVTGGTAVAPPRPLHFTEEEKAKVLELRQAGWTQKAIAAHLGRSVDAVCKTLYRAGVKNPRPGRMRSS